MLTLRGYIVDLNESSNEEKLTHLEHAEDHPINAGHEGYAHAHATLTGVADKLRGKSSKVSITTKYDGSPSVVFGHHPESGKFFVASKSAFNKNPKLNYSNADIEKNHGHAPGLVSKLKDALHHLPKVTPSKGIYQGDFMYSKKDNDVEEKSGSYHFKPNTITYSSKANSEEGKKIKAAKIGVAVHTAYTGKDFDNMKAHYNADLSHFGTHKDVHVISPHIKHEDVHFTPEAQNAFESHMKKAEAADKSLQKSGNYGHLQGHTEHMKAYINKTVREGSMPSVEGYKEHLTQHFAKAGEKLKSEAGKQKNTSAMKEHLGNVGSNEGSFKKTFELHHHLQAAKDVLVNTLSGAKHAFHHSIGGNAVKPEGFVASLNNRPTKLVDRAEFSRSNFLARPR